MINQKSVRAKNKKRRKLTKRIKDSIRDKNPVFFKSSKYKIGA